MQKDRRVIVADTRDRSDARQLSDKMRTLQENYCQRLLRTSWDTLFKKLIVDQLHRISGLIWSWKFHDEVYKNPGHLHSQSRTRFWVVVTSLEPT